MTRDLKQEMIKLVCGMPEVTKVYYLSRDGSIYTETSEMSVGHDQFYGLWGDSEDGNRKIEFKNWNEVKEKVTRIDFLNDVKYYTAEGNLGRMIVTINNGRQFYVKNAHIFPYSRNYNVPQIIVKRYDPIADKFAEWKRFVLGRDIKTIVFPRTTPTFCDECGRFISPDFVFCPYDRQPLR